LVLPDIDCSVHSAAVRLAAAIVVKFEEEGGLLCWSGLTNFLNSDCQCTLKWDYINYCNKKHSQSVPKTFGRTSPNSILEEFFLFDYANFMQFLLDWGLGLVVFDADCLVSKKKKYNVIFTGNQDFIYC
jgi:hypothetical protein